MIFIARTVLGCGGETQERPRPAHATPRIENSKPSDAPLPNTAFRDDDASSSSSPSPSSRTLRLDDGRFATRTIGESAGERGERRFHGAPVDLDLKSVDVHDVFRLLSDVGKVNIVVAGEVSGSVTMRLRHVPWDQALDVVAQARGLAYSREGNVIVVRPLASSGASSAAPAKPAK